ncbi:metalloenzyme [Pseudanabaena sp. FACHB-2040]|uniref:metalloenzyme n=1 Tax=Pseudanabaena sp. FACHB-2040 TaxID=2692859 RepID=UPI00168641AF|nr:metalloenzyme [Pseudanabaena sp. FACHB-2040]MBD2256997.1 metalloenzyme [Pseudanabaena sp. FACHB-2040]
MASPQDSFIFLFLDGVGLAPASAQNPLAAANAIPYLTSLLGMPLIQGCDQQTPTLLCKPIDACLGVPGLPQSATGQTSLYTGRNAPEFRGQHQTGFANGSLRPLIEEWGLFKRVLQLGGTATMANLYSPQYFEAIANRRVRYSVGTLLTLTAGLPFRMQYEYEQGEAIFWDITGDFARYRGIAAAPITPQEAGKRLATLGGQYTVTLFESYLTDFAGHDQDIDQAVRVLQLVDAFLESVITHLPSHVTLVVSSDHGNLEDLSTKKHTLNPVPLLVVGKAAAAFQSVTDLTGITPTILSLVGQSQSGPEKWQSILQSLLKSSLPPYKTASSPEKKRAKSSSKSPFLGEIRRGFAEQLANNKLLKRSLNPLAKTAPPE